MSGFTLLLVMVLLPAISHASWKLPGNKVGPSIGVLNLDDAGQTAGTAAMAVSIMATCAVAKLLHGLLGAGLKRRQSAWRGA
jgi:hypothetical protein